MPADLWRKANQKGRRGQYHAGGAGPTGPVAKTPLVTRRCTRCKTNTPRKGYEHCRPCEKLVGVSVKLSETPTDKKKTLTKAPSGPTAYSRETLESMHHVVKEVVTLNGLDYNSPEYRLLAALGAMLGHWPRVSKLVFQDVQGRYMRMLERLDEQ
jgi:hypothetical protein